jgi:phosphatidate cytidylyltransferase
MTMSPSLAMHSEIFRAYFAIVLTLLAGAGIVLAIMKWVARRPVDHAWAAYKSWLFMAPLVLLAIFMGRTFFIVTGTLLSLFAFKEIARSTGLYEDWSMTGVVYLGILSMGAFILLEDPRLHVPGWYGMFMTLPVYVISLIFLVPILHNRVAGQLQKMALAIVGFIYMGWMFGHLVFLANATNAYGYILYLLFAVELNDIAAFTSGKLFGKHPLRSNVSPKKTWEGSLGALAVSMVLPWLLWFSFPHFEPRDLIVVGLIVGIGGQLGDLSISVIKRDLGVKDMGALIPGHGGLLDRIDSLLYVAPLFFHYVRWRFNIY